jgi:hypothetical protein
MVFSTISISRAMSFCFRTGFRLMIDLSALVTCGVRITRDRPDLLQSLTLPVSKNNLTVAYDTQKTRVIFNGFSNSKILALSISHLRRAITAIRFSLSVHSMATAQTRLECFDAFIAYMSTSVMSA